MIAVINDVSFRYPYTTIGLAVDYMHQFLNICKRIEKDEVTNIHEIKTGVINTQADIAPNYKLIQLIQEFKEKEERSLLLSLLTNRGTYKVEEESVCEIDKHESYVCGMGINNFLISLFLYGKGKVGSRMDLRDEEAQELLNKTVYIKGRLSFLSRCKAVEHFEMTRNNSGLN